MSNAIEQRLEELGIDVPQAAAPAANYIPFRISGNMLYISGQLLFVDGKLPTTGIVGDSVSSDDAYSLARQCGVNLISVMKLALNKDLTRVKAIVKLGGFVASTPISPVSRASSTDVLTLMVEVFGDVGRHARSAVACPSLPLGTPVEIDAIVEIA